MGQRAEECPHGWLRRTFRVVAASCLTQFGRVLETRRRRRLPVGHESEFGLWSFGPGGELSKSERAYPESTPRPGYAPQGSYTPIRACIVCEKAEPVNRKEFPSAFHNGVGSIDFGSFSHVRRPRDGGLSRVRCLARTPCSILTKQNMCAIITSTCEMRAADS